jgi:NADPH:quinone reductase-like Zn-dependent oxidoreductase
VAKLVAAIAERHSVPVVSIVRRRDSIEILKKQLPRATFIASDTEGWEEKVKAAAPAGGFRAGLDSVGGQIGTFVLDSLTNGGTLITYGDLSGAPLQANALSFAMRDTRISGRNQMAGQSREGAACRFGPCCRLRARPVRSFPRCRRISPLTDRRRSARR